MAGCIIDVQPVGVFDGQHQLAGGARADGRGVHGHRLDRHGQLTAVLGARNRFRFHFKSETPAGLADGLQEMWINGTKVFRAANRSFGYPSATGSSWFGTFPALVDSGYLLGAANSGYTALTVFYVDDVKFYLINPGW